VRRASTFVVRASNNVRKTIKLKLGQRVDESNDQLPRPSRIGHN
jgi:hypothetical protein